jgi:deazaflavin-dependent oxidoreductase (nitroreductase family)
MPLPRSLARFNKRVTNRITGRLAPRLPGFGVVVHTGRKSHMQYRTPLNVFWRGGKLIIALTYGPEADWVRNVLAQGGCLLETRGRTLRLSQPRLLHDERRSVMPPHVRFLLGINHVNDFLELTPGAPHRG